MKSNNAPKAGFVVCITNDDDPASLEPRKIYQVVPNAEAAAHHLLRVIDESGEDYLFPADHFVAIELPVAAERAFSVAS
jgi:hypothetical protein